MYKNNNKKIELRRSNCVVVSFNQDTRIGSMAKQYQALACQDTHFRPHKKKKLIGLCFFSKIGRSQIQYKLGSGSVNAV